MLVLAITSVGGFAVAGPTMAAQLGGRTSVQSIVVGSTRRTFRVHRPGAIVARPGLVVVLHGVFGSGFQAEVVTGFDAQAGRLGWIAAYPDGVLDGWDAFGSNADWGRHPGADDVAFVAALIDRLVASEDGDPGHVFVTGFSRGGLMAHRLGCELASRVAAIAPVAGNMATEAGSAASVPCAPAQLVSVLAIHGTADGMIPIAGGRVGVLFAPLADVMAKWRAVDDCTGPAMVVADGPSTTTSWACPGGATVAMRVLAGGGHAWPGSPTNGAASVEASFDASALIADFFVAHARAPGPTGSRGPRRTSSA